MFPVEFILERGRNLDVIYVHMCVLSEVILKFLCIHQETGEIRYLEMEIGGLPGNIGSKSAKSFNK